MGTRREPNVDTVSHDCIRALKAQPLSDLSGYPTVTIHEMNSNTQ